MDKIETIRSKFPDKVQNIPSVPTPEIVSKMIVFERATEDKIVKLILSSSSKSRPHSYKRAEGVIVYPPEINF